MSSNSQIIGGRRVSVPVREREQDSFRYFRVDSAALNVARPDGKRISFLKGWYKTKNVGDINYLLELIDEGQIGSGDPPRHNLASFCKKISQQYVIFIIDLQI